MGSKNEIIFTHIFYDQKKWSTGPSFREFRVIMTLAGLPGPRDGRKIGQKKGPFLGPLFLQDPFRSEGSKSSVGNLTSGASLIVCSIGCSVGRGEWIYVRVMRIMPVSRLTGRRVARGALLHKGGSVRECGGFLHTQVVPGGPCSLPSLAPCLLRGRGLKYDVNLTPTPQENFEGA